MQYVEVAVNTKINKTGQLFTYSIPPQFLPYIKPGILVEVPFQNQKLPGVILEIIKSVPMSLKNKLKTISRIITKYPIINDVQLKLANWLSNYYFSPLGQVISFMIPPIGRNFVFAGDIITKPKIAKNNNIYTLYGDWEDRLKNYLTLIKKVVANNRQVLVLFADLNTCLLFYRFIKQYFSENNIALINSGAKNTEKAKNWREIKNGSKTILLGTRSAIFSPFGNLGLIILDQPENYGYKEEQTIKYDTLLAAKKLSELNNNHLVIGSNAKTVDNLYFEQKKTYKTLKNDLVFKDKKISLIDSSKDKGYISWQLCEEIEKALRHKKSVLILVNKRGEGSYLSCGDCNYIFKCANCDLPLVPYEKTGSSLKCHKCNYSINSPKKCPNCQGTKLQNVGLGVEKIANKLRKIFPKSDGLIIGTQKILERQYKNIALAAIIGLDNILNFPDYKSTEKALILISKLLNITQSKLSIQTHHIETKFMQLIKAKQFSQILESELKKRHLAHYPPYAQLAKLVYKNRDEKKCQAEAQKAFDKLIAKADQNLEILEPFPCFIAKKRNYYYWQIILKNKRYKGLDDFKIPKLLSEIPLKDGWRVEIDPISLL